MRVALYGGSFNPPHVGHVMTVAHVMSVLGPDEFWWVPCFSHAFGKALVPFEHRFEMCKLASHPFTDSVKVSDIEAQMGTQSRTIDTVEMLMSQLPDARFTLVIGADILQEKHLWKRFEELEKLVDFYVLGRAGIPGDQDEFDIELPDVSSTDIRHHLSHDNVKPCRNLVPAAVLDYIEHHKLYT